MVGSIFTKWEKGGRGGGEKYRPSYASFSKYSKFVEEESLPADWSVISRGLELFVYCF